VGIHCCSLKWVFVLKKFFSLEFVFPLWCQLKEPKYLGKTGEKLLKVDIKKAVGAKLVNCRPPSTEEIVQEVARKKLKLR